MGRNHLPPDARNPPRARPLDDPQRTLSARKVGEVSGKSRIVQRGMMGQMAENPYRTERPRALGSARGNWNAWKEVLLGC